MAELLEARLWERLELARTAGTEAPVAAPYADRWFEAESASATVTAGTAAPQPLDPALLGLWRNQQQLALERCAAWRRALTPVRSR